MENRYVVDTPENIAFSYDIAGIGSRFLAAIIDTFLIGLAEVIILLVAGLAAQSFGLGQSILVAGGAVLGFIVLWGYYLAFELAWNGQSPGKRMLGLRVVREGGRPITLMASVIRNFIRLVDFLPVLYGIGVVCMFVDLRARRLGDLAAGVVVVRVRGEVSLESLTERSVAPVGVAGRLTNVPMINAADYALVLEFMNRRGDLGATTRARIAAQLVRGFEQRLAVQAGPGSESFLEQVIQTYQLQQADLLASRADRREDAETN